MEIIIHGERRSVRSIDVRGIIVVIRRCLGWSMEIIIHGERRNGISTGRRIIKRGVGWVRIRATITISRIIKGGVCTV